MARENELKEENTSLRQELQELQLHSLKLQQKGVSQEDYKEPQELYEVNS